MLIEDACKKNSCTKQYKIVGQNSRAWGIQTHEKNMLYLGRNVLILVNLSHNIMVIHIQVVLLLLSEVLSEEGFVEN